MKSWPIIAIAVSAMMIVTLVSLVFLFLNRRYLRGPRG